MKKFLKLSLFIVCIVLFENLSAQIMHPVKWDFSVKKVSSCEAELLLHAKIEDKWHLYGQESSGGDGPIPTSFTFTKNSNYELIGKISEKTLIKKFEAVWGAEISYFEHEAFFTQKIKMKSDKPFDVKGSLEFMVCNGTQCLAPETVDFSFKVSDGKPCPAFEK